MSELILCKNCAGTLYVCRRCGTPAYFCLDTRCRNDYRAEHEFVDCPECRKTKEKPKVELEACKLSDGKLSIRVNGKEVHILPGKKECSVEEINVMLCDIAEHIEEKLLPEDEEGW